MATHVGTHIDAPCHRVDGAQSISDLPLSTFTGQALVIPVEAGADEEISPETVAGALGSVRPGDIVILSTGFWRHFEEPEYLRHPYVSTELAQLLAELQVKMLGVDLITPDAPVALRPPDFDYPVHTILLSSGIPIIENLTNLDECAGRQVTLTAYPINIAGADAAPARVIAEY
jgi:kynurenine formamidase